MRALLIKLAGVRTTWTDTGERTATPTARSVSFVRRIQAVW